MRSGGLLLTVLAAATFLLGVTAQAEELKQEGDIRQEPPPQLQRIFIPNIATDYRPETCSPNVPDPCLLPKTQLTLTRANHGQSVILVVEIASRSDQRQRGLMFRDSLNDLEGMLFVFPTDHSTGFWMRNTLIPLDIAYLGADGTVLEIVQGIPNSLEILTPTQPYRYALEVNGG
ncbi:MAG TPA: hypothetical protein DGL25_01495, partial [Dehalococcoidia bacterium]|nr:hypothetical protein [Dehalococcoidia bacterium]